MLEGNLRSDFQENHKRRMKIKVGALPVSEGSVIRYDLGTKRVSKRNIMRRK